MKRTITTTLAATALFGLTACKGGGSAAIKLIPESAVMIGGIDAAGLMKSKLYTDHKDKFMKGPASEMMEAGKACNIDVNAMKSVVFGTDGKDGTAVVISGPGIGDEKNLTCIADKIKEKMGGEKAPFTIEDKQLKMDGDRGTAYIVDGTTLAFATTSWAGAVKELVDGKGKSAVDGANKDIFASADKSKHIWFAGKVPAEMAGMIQADGLESVHGSIHLASGVELSATGTFADAEKPAALAKMVADNKESAKKMAADLATAIDAVTIEAKDKTLVINAKISDEDANKAVAMAENMGGMM